MTSFDQLLPQRQTSFRFDLLDENDGSIGEIHPDTPCTVTNDTGRGINRTLDGLVLNATEATDVNPFSDRVIPYMTVGDEVYPLGKFIFTDPSSLYRSWGKELSSNLADLNAIVDQPLAESVSFPAGYRVRDALFRMFADLPFYPEIDVLGSVFGSPVTWRAGTSTLQVINDLAALGGFLPLFFSNEGVPRIIAPPDIESSNLHIYETGDRIFEDSIVETSTLIDAPNRWVVVDTSATESPIVGEYVLSASEPHSFENRGFYVTRLIEMQGVGTVANAKNAAYTSALNEPPLTTITFDAAPDPRHDTYDIVNFLGSRYREISWSLELAEGAAMSHTIQRAI